VATDQGGDVSVVLIVERDAALRADLALAVRAAGYAAVEASDGPAGRALAAERDVRAALVDLDALSSLDELAALRRAAPSLGIVATCASSRLGDVVAARRAGACEVLRKPFPVDALEVALGLATRGGGSARPRPEALGMLCEDPRMLRLLEEATAAAASDATLLIIGESGTGKDLLARIVHARSARRSGPLVTVNCAALPDGLAESELFGHERGAFTGASEARGGLITAAEGGTLVLDEIADASHAIQPKLLRFVQEREVQPVGATSSRRVDVRLVATSQRELADEVRLGRFREDLYYRLDVIVLRIPPLRERRGEVAPLARRFLSRFAEQAGVEPPRLSPRVLARLEAQPFRGNVRELENWMRRAVVLFPGREIEVERLLGRARPPLEAVAAPGPATLNLRELERDAILRSLRQVDGNRTAASRVLGISVRTLRNKIRAYGLA
jgi:two-component system response regulator FlrC